ncbi:hypothetical protein BG004_004387 [Podila humilis]|nr:hypothetical protein BG004_004387 [Podila humilis]
MSGTTVKSASFVEDTKVDFDIVTNEKTPSATALDTLSPSSSSSSYNHDNALSNTNTITSTSSHYTSLPAPSHHHHDELEDNTNIPKMSHWQIFRFFFVEFGLMAWGGPVAQIAKLKEQLVIQKKWITVARFNRVYAVYQMLPGPEASEICMFFGCLIGGRVGGIVAGLGFVLPALQPVVAAMVLKAVFKIGEHAFISNKNNKFNLVLFILAILGALQSALRINYFITLGVFGVFYSLWARGWKWAAGVVMASNYIGYALYVVFKGVPSPTALALGIAPSPDLPHLLALGLVAGSLSFGGAYTAIPFVQAEAVILGGWLTKQTFLDGIALGNIIPAPLVIFATFVGFQGGHVDGGLGHAFAGAVLMTFGMFFPCFLFTIAGHSVLERICRNETMASFFDGITGSVVGIIAVTALDITKAAIIQVPKNIISSHGGSAVLGEEQLVIIAARNTLSAVIFVLAFMVLNSVKHQYISILLVVVAAISGQFLFVDN